MADNQDQYGIFTTQRARQIVRAVEILEKSGLLDPAIIAGLLAGSQSLDVHPVLVKNVSGEEIPAYACMQATGTFDKPDGGENYLEVDKPADADGSAGFFVFNNHVPIPADEFGEACGRANLRALRDGSAVSSGDKWAPKANQWYITKEDTGIFIIAGDDDILSTFPSGASGVSKVAFAGGSGNAKTKIGYEIISATTETSTSSPYQGKKTASVTILETPAGLYDMLYGTVATVVDQQGCYLNEDNADLVGRRGWAVWGEAKSMANGATGSAGPHWIVDGLCCPDDGTGFAGTGYLNLT